MNTSLFNFLENLLVFRTLEELSVPPESHVKFRISRQTGDPGICLLIHTDNQRHPVFEEGAPRPDYLALYLHGDGCICTIIEMKSTADKNLEHGLEQIKALADRLKREFADHLPPRFHLHVQGILLCQPNAQVPGARIAKMAAAGLTVFPAQCNSRAELYPYVCRRNDLKDRFENNIVRSPEPPGVVEEMLSRNSLRKRLPDTLTGQQAGEGAGRGLHVNYALSDGGEYAVLVTRGNKCVFVVSERGDQHQERLRDDIAACGMTSPPTAWQGNSAWSRCHKPPLPRDTDCPSSRPLGLSAGLCYWRGRPPNATERPGKVERADTKDGGRTRSEGRRGEAESLLQQVARRSGAWRARGDRHKPGPAGLR